MPDERRWEFEPWLYTFKVNYRGDKGPPELTYRTLRYLLDLWNDGATPQEAVQLVKERAGVLLPFSSGSADKY